MPVSHRVFPDFELLVTRYLGDVSGKQLLDAYKSACADERFHPGMDELVLLDEVADLEVDLKTLARLAEMTTKSFILRQR